MKMERKMTVILYIVITLVFFLGLGLGIQIAPLVYSIFG